MGLRISAQKLHLLGKRFVFSIISLAVLGFSTASGQETTDYKNLKVLDKNISREDLGKAMLQNLYGLGLPRRQREGCLFCHVGSMDTPVGEWKFDSDEKETKKKARVMMQMVEDINANYLATLDGRLSAAAEGAGVRRFKGYSLARRLLEGTGSPPQSFHFSNQLCR